MGGRHHCHPYFRGRYRAEPPRSRRLLQRGREPGAHTVGAVHSVRFSMRPFSNCPTAEESRVELLDRIFLTIFARYRRKLGEPRVNSAWVRAVGKMTGFLILPTAALTFTLVIVVYLVNGSGTPADHMRWGKIAVIVGWLGLALLLQARFTKYLRMPPRLVLTESSQDRHAVFWFRAICVAIFLSICVAALLLGILGLGARLGF